MKIRNQQDFLAGLMFMAFGLFFAGFGTEYKFGTGANMGPGYFPTALGVILILLGFVITEGGLSSKAPEEKVEKCDFSVVLLILGSVFVFGLILGQFGLIAALFALVVISGYASHEFNWRTTMVNAAVLAVMCVLIFVVVLKLQIKLWPSFVGK
jgi:hypothetical protein